MKKQFVLCAATIAPLLFVTIEARAQDTTCNNQFDCAAWLNSSSDTGANGIDAYITQSTGGAAVYGTDSSSGTNSFGVFGGSNNGTGVGGRGWLVGLHGTSQGGVTGIGVLGDGDVDGAGIGVEGTSSTNFGVEGSSGSIGVYGVSTADNFGVYGRSNGAGTGVEGYNPGSGYAGYFSGNLAYTGSFAHVSDERLKKDIQPMSGALDQVLRLRGVTFEWKEPSEHGGMSGKQRGFIAQEVEKVFPEWVRTDPNNGFKILDDTGLGALEVESLRALKAKNDALEERVQALEANRRPMISGLSAEGMGMGFGLVALGGAFLVSRRKHSGAGGRE